MSAKTLCCNSNIHFGAALLAIAAFTACGKGASAPTSVAAPEPAPVAAPVETGGPFAIKAGMYEMKMPMDMKNTVYFEDFGKKQATYTEMGGKMMSISFNNNDGSMLSCVPMTKSCTKMMMPAVSAPMAEGSAPAADRKALEAKEVAGKMSEGWEVTAAGTTSKVWTYKNIPMRTEAAGAVMEVTMLSEEAPAADKFTVPEGYTTKDM